MLTIIISRTVDSQNSQKSWQLNYLKVLMVQLILDGFVKKENISDNQLSMEIYRFRLGINQKTNDTEPI